MPRHFTTDDPHYTLYGYLSDRVVPFEAASQMLVDKLTPEYGGVIYHARAIKAENEFGCTLQLLHLAGRHKKTLEYAVFYGDASQLPKLDARRPRFVDVTETSGISIAQNTDVGGTNPHGVAVEDFNGDGHLDVIITTFGAPYVRYFTGNGDLTFRDVTRGSGLEGFGGEGTGAAVADFDRDGHLDVYLTALRSGASGLYRGKGDGTFTDVSRAAGVLWDRPARSCAASDVDGDGWLDLYVTSPEGANALFRNQRNGTFTDIAKLAGVALADRHSLGCAFGDCDGDGRDDLFVTNYQSQVSALFKNLGDGNFRDITAEAGLNRKASAVGCVLADVFRQGRLDLFVTTDSWLSGVNATEPELLAQGNTVEPNLLYRNNGQGRFTPAADETLKHKTLSHDAVLEDLDHDGQIDLYAAVDAIPTGNRFATHKGGNPSWRREGIAWQKVEDAWGINHQGNCVCAPAADFDGDGDLDLLLVNFYSNVIVYRNETNDKNWLQIRAKGTKSNPNGIGAKVRVTALRDGREELAGFRQIQSGAGYARSSPLVAHIGLGASPAANYRVEVIFPGTNQRVVKHEVTPGQRLTIAEPAE